MIFYKPMVICDNGMIARCDDGTYVKIYLSSGAVVKEWHDKENELMQMFEWLSSNKTFDEELFKI